MDENTKEEKAVDPVNVNIEIDYDKLAMAIVKAQKLASAMDGNKKEGFVEDATNEQNLNRWKKFCWKMKQIKTDFFNKFKEQSIIVKLLSLCSCFFFLLAGVVGFFVVPTIMHKWKWFIILSTGDRVWKIYYYLLFASGEILSGMLIFSAVEILNSKDKNFTFSVFSALTSLVALIVAVIALRK